jgi:hypothetical protein
LRESLCDTRVADPRHGPRHRHALQTLVNDSLAGMVHHEGGGSILRGGLQTPLQTHCRGSPGRGSGGRGARPSRTAFLRDRGEGWWPGRGVEERGTIAKKVGGGRERRAAGIGEGSGEGTGGECSEGSSSSRAHQTCEVLEPSAGCAIGVISLKNKSTIAAVKTTALKRRSQEHARARGPWLAFEVVRDRRGDQSSPRVGCFFSVRADVAFRRSLGLLRRACACARQCGAGLAQGGTGGAAQGPRRRTGAPSQVLRGPPPPPSTGVPPAPLLHRLACRTGVPHVRARGQNISWRGDGERDE